MSILTKTYPYWFSEDQREEIESRDSLYLIHYTEFDSLGNIVVEKTRGGDFMGDSYYKNKYGTSGLLVSRINCPVADFRADWCKVDTFIYNSKDLLTQIRTVGDSLPSQVFKYNAKGQKISERHSDNVFGYTTRYEYDGEKVVKETGDFHKCIFFYNKKDQLIKKILFFTEPDTVNLISYAYNDLGQLIQTTDYHYKSKQTSVERMKYNLYGEIAEKGRLLYVYDYFKQP